MSSTLPPRLSDRQLFVLAFLARVGEHTSDAGVGAVYGAPSRSLSRRVADEFGGYDADGNLSDNHRSTHPVSLDRLADRGLIERRERGRHAHPDAPALGIRLTPDGREAGKEALRRHRDGRYSLTFETIE